MRLAYDENDLAIAEAASSLLAADPPILQIRAAARTEMLPDAEHWARYAEQGWFGLSIAEEAGGVGYGLAEQVVLFHEIGRALVPGPVVATVVAARMAARAGATELAAAFVDGSARAALVITDGDELADLAGETVLVADGLGADYLLVLTPSAASLFDLATAEKVEGHRALDPAGRLLSCVLPSGEPVLSSEDVAAVRADAQILSAAVLSGVADAVVDMSVAYTSVRTQFGKPIGTFQAIQHRCASMAARSQAARSQVMFAGLSVDLGAADAQFNASVALAVAADAALLNSEDNMRNHAGIAITYEHNAHFFVTRARAVAGALGLRSGLMRAIAEAPSPNLAGID